MSIMTQEGVKAALGREIPEEILVIAKLAITGMEAEEIAGVLGSEKSDITEIIESQDYKDVRLLVGVEHARIQTNKDFSWDFIEHAALEGISRKIGNIRDPEELLRYAAVANKAVRRLKSTQEHVLDPANAQTRVPLKLTRRFTEKLNSDQQVIERTEVQQISVINGTAKTPDFDTISQTFGIGASKESLPRSATNEGMDELERFMSGMPMLEGD